MQEDEDIDIDDEAIDAEDHFIMRLPEEVAQKLKEILMTEESGLENRVSIRLEDDLRSGTVSVDRWVLHGNIVDLPTVVESLKTVDGSHFYKTADISKMMVCKYQENDSEGTIGLKDEIKPKAKHSSWPHGLTPPMKNARKHKFRKTKRNPDAEDPDVLDEVRRLLRFDSDAVSTRYEVVEEVSSTASQSNSFADDGSITDAFSSLNEAQRYIFGELLSDSDENEQAAGGEEQLNGMHQDQMELVKNGFYQGPELNNADASKKTKKKKKSNGKRRSLLKKKVENNLSN